MRGADVGRPWLERAVPDLLGRRGVRERRLTDLGADEAGLVGPGRARRAGRAPRERELRRVAGMAATGLYAARRKRLPSRGRSPRSGCRRAGRSPRSGPPGRGRLVDRKQIVQQSHNARPRLQEIAAICFGTNRTAYRRFGPGIAVSPSARRASSLAGSCWCSSRAACVCAYPGRRRTRRRGVPLSPKFPLRCCQAHLRRGGHGGRAGNLPGRGRGARARGQRRVAGRRALGPGHGSRRPRRLARSPATAARRSNRPALPLR